tara:strand:- start:658 stop:2235 length:1578 start_codon:yes stop_codon:yes gene_type:complete
MEEVGPEVTVDKVIDKLAFYIDRWQRYPLAFVIEACQGWKHGYPTHQQAEVLMAVPNNRYIAIKSGHGVGKTRLEAWLHFWHLVCNKIPGIPLKCLCTGPTKNTVENVLWEEIKLVRGHMMPFLADSFVVTEEECRYAHGENPWFSCQRTASKDNPDAMQGFHGTPLIVCEEPSGMPDGIFEVLSGVMSDEDARAIMFGNPTRPSGFFYRAFVQKASIWKGFQFNCRDCLTSKTYSYDYYDPAGVKHVIEVRGRVTPESIAEKEETFGADSNVVRVRVNGDFPIEAKDQLIPTAHITRCFDRELPEQQPGAVAIMGIDVADEGADFSAMALRMGNVVVAVDRWRRSIPDTNEFIISKYHEYIDAGIPITKINIEKNGVGAGVFKTVRDRLMESPVVVQAIVPHEKPWADGGVKCKRMRDWLWWQARLFFSHKAPIFADNGSLFQQLAKELAVPKYDDSEGPLAVETKKSIRNRGESSPDIADALIFTFYGSDRIAIAKEKKEEMDYYRKLRTKERKKKPRSWVGV